MRNTSEQGKSTGKTVAITLGIVALVLVCAALVYLYVTVWSKNELEKDGYVFVEKNDWYEKEGDMQNELLVNFTRSGETLSRRYVVPVTVDHIVFIGASYKNYLDFCIVVAPRSTPVTLEFRDFSYTAPKETVALDASGVSDEEKVYLVADGMVQITGGAGTNGMAGAGYAARAGSYDAARDGERGTDGGEGAAAVWLNLAYVQINPGAQLKLTGGKGGTGGAGGQGEGSDAPGTPRAGAGGNGGRGGQGAPALLVESGLQVDNGGTFLLQGGAGGKGGDAGNGGIATVKIQTDKYDDGGHGGTGGEGGQGSVAMVQLSGTAPEITGRKITLTAGNGGEGGKGGDGGKTGATFMHTANPGNGGRGGKGGDSAVDGIEHDLVTVKGGKGGTGGKGGKAGTGDNRTGSGGANGADGRSF